MLRDTSKIGNYSPQHLLECEARHVMKLPRWKQLDHYEKILPIRGEKTMNALVDEVRRQTKIASEKLKVRDEQTSEMEM